ncbi:MAG: type I methionyl aminopeptidase [Verrucomicrobiae bacterium]|nr:type I methionyl aminopeptidase [Verrucomicrobiae bacterium]MCP5541563.1 type I methionyl aminopeptidase [Akkermansiaceae bacterium]
MAKKKKRIHYRFGREAEAMREAGRIAAEILAGTAELVKPGATTGEIDRAAAELIAGRGCRSAFLGYRGFPGHICISLNQEVVHGIGNPKRVIGEGDIVKIDVGIVTPGGWVGDNAKTVAAGTPSPAALRLMFATEECLEVAIRHAQTGNRLSDLCVAVEECAQGFGYTVVREMVGHGVGRELHEEPQVPNYWDFSTMGRGPKLAPGMVLAIEPMINAGTAEIVILEDQWTVVTADGDLSAHFEHSVMITEGEPIILTPRPRLVSRQAVPDAVAAEV